MGAGGAEGGGALGADQVVLFYVLVAGGALEDGAEFVEEGFLLQLVLEGFFEGAGGAEDDVKDEAGEVEGEHQQREDDLGDGVAGAGVDVADGPDDGGEPEGDEVCADHDGDDQRGVFWASARPVEGDQGCTRRRARPRLGQG